MHNFSNARSPDPSQTARLVQENETNFFAPSRFNFLNEHKGLRPGLMHILLGTTGSGKTTLARGLLADLSQECRVLVYSTEETAEQFQTQAAYASKVKLENIAFAHEADYFANTSGAHDIDGFIAQLRWSIDIEKPKVLFFDNITTSVFYDQNKQAGYMTSRLRALMVERNIPFFVVAHTGSNVRDNTWFEASQVRGFRNIVNAAEYLYCLFRFRSEIRGYTESASFIYVDKSRMHEGGKKIYRLGYDSRAKTYTDDRPEDYAKMVKFLRSKT